MARVYALLLFMFLPVALLAQEPSQFTNPILPAPSADPWMILDQGCYYLTESRDNSIVVRRSPRLTAIGSDSGVTVWKAPSSGPNSDEIWAPEIHRILDRWYIYFAADNGANANHRMWVIRSSGTSPLGPYDTCAQLNTGGWSIDGTTFEGSNGRRYFIWSGWPGSTDGIQQLYIAPMDDPMHISASRTLLTSPTEPWERHAMPICEGPEALTHNGRTMLVYSASGSWTRHYCLGLLELTGSDYLDPASWKKRGPVFAGTDSVFGVGHCSFVPSPDGSEEWILYHAKEKVSNGWNDRSVRAQRFTWTPDGLPAFGRPAAAGKRLAEPSGKTHELCPAGP